MNNNSNFAIVMGKKEEKKNKIEVSKAIIYHINERSEPPRDSLFIHKTRKSK
jgi:hypothetical protein